MSTPLPRLILKGYWRSSATWRVRIALHLKKIDFTYIPIHLVRNGGEQHTDHFKLQNPMEQVPLLEIHYQDHVQVLTQSMAIVSWLDDLHPNPLLFPTDPWQKAQVIQRAEVINSGIQPLQNLAILQWVEKQYQGDKIEWGSRYIQKGLLALEQMCSGEETDFLVGQQPTMADLCLIPQLYNARRFKLDLMQFPRLCEVESRCKTLKAFEQAHPNQQSDAQL